MGYKIVIDSCDTSSKNDYYIKENVDTCAGGLITFKSTVDCYKSLRWIIGFDPTVFTQKEFSLFFDDTWIGQTIHLTLITKLETNGQSLDELKKMVFSKCAIYEEYCTALWASNDDDTASFY